MTFDFLLRDSLGWTLIFFALVAVAVFPQLTKTTVSRSLPVILRALLKAAPALFLAGVAWYLDQSLAALLFLLCAIGDVFLDLPEDKVPHGFQIGAVAF